MSQLFIHPSGLVSLFFLKGKKFSPYKFHNTQIKGISLLNESLKNGARLENHSNGERKAVVGADVIFFIFLVELLKKVT